MSYENLKKFLTLPKAQMGMTVNNFDPNNPMSRYNYVSPFQGLSQPVQAQNNFSLFGQGMFPSPNPNTGLPVYSGYNPTSNTNLDWLTSLNNSTISESQKYLQPEAPLNAQQDYAIPDYVAEGMGNQWMTQNQGQAPQRVVQQQYSNEDPILQNILRWQQPQPTTTPTTATQETQQAQQPFNLFNPYGGGIDNMSALSYGFYNAGAGNYGQSALGFGKGILGLARQGFSAYGAGRSQADLLNRQNNEPVVSTNYLQKGGEVSIAKFLSGKYTTDSSNPTVEIERDEFVLNSETGTVSQAIGETHEKGGIKTDLPAGSQVLSDHTKIGAKTAKELSKELDIKVKAKNTFADVLDKYSKKIGVEKNIEAGEKLLEDTENTLRMEETDTKQINMDFIQEENARIEAEKQELNAQQQEAFQTIFQKQEAKKGNFLQEGGETIAPAAQEQEVNPADIIVQVQQMIAQGMPVEEVLNGLLSMGYQEDEASQIIQASQAQQQPQMQAGGIARYYSPLDVNTGNFGRQNFTRGVNLSVSPEEALRRLQMQYQTLPNLINRTGIGTMGQDTAMTGITEDGSRFGQFQVGYNNYLDKAIEAININPNISKEEKQQLIERLGTERFGEGLARDFDQIYGDFTSSRSGVNLPTLTKADRDKYGNTIQRIGDVVNKDGSIKKEFSELSDGAKKYIQDVVKKGGEPTYDIGLLDIDAPIQEVVNQPQPTVSTNPATAETPTTQQATQQGRRTAIPMFPTVEGLPPSQALIPRGDEVRFNRIQPVIRTPEASIAAINNQTNFATEQAYLSNPNLAPFLTATNLGTTQQSVNKAIAETDAYNAESINRANTYNANIGDKEQLMNINLAGNYEQRLFKTIGNQEEDWRRYLLQKQMQNKQNWMDVNNLNLQNAMFPNYQTDGSNVYFSNPKNYSLPQDQVALNDMFKNMTDAQKAQYLNNYKQEGGYIYEFDQGATDITDQQAQELAQQTGFTPEFAREYFRQPPQMTAGANGYSQPPRTFNPQVDLIADITTDRNRYSPDGGMIVGEYKKIWNTNRPEYFAGKPQPREGVDFTYMSAQDFAKFQQSQNYKAYKAGYKNPAVASR